MKAKRVFICAAAAILCGCQQNPDSGIVVHKDMEKVISEAENSGEGKEDLSEMRENTAAHYETDLFSSSMNIAANIKADVEIPEVGGLSLLRVQQHHFTQNEIDKVVQLLYGGEQIYDVEKSASRTRQQIEDEIARSRNLLSGHDAALSEGGRADLEHEIARLENLLKTALEEYENIPSDGRLRPVSETGGYEHDPLAFLREYSPDGEGLCVCDRDYTAMLTAYNSENYSNSICYTRSPVGPTDRGMQNGNAFYPLTYQSEGKALDRVVPENFVLNGVYDETLQQIEGDSCTLSQADAEAQAEAFLHEIGMDGFGLYLGGQYHQYLRDEVVDWRQAPFTQHEVRYLYRTVYILRYCREIGGVMLRPDTGTKFAAENNDASFRGRLWYPEGIEFIIDDSGIVGFIWDAPLEVTEVVIDNAAMKPFDEIRSTFEKFLLFTNASGHEETGTFSPVRVSIDSITLSYSRISEKDRFDTGLVVPVWGFSGTRSVLSSDSILKEQAALTGAQAYEFCSQPEYGVRLAINAIDGSVIDAELGY